MYDLEYIKTVHLEITSKCQASCPMCARNIQGGIENPWLIIDEIYIEQFKKWFTLEILSNLDRLYMCGNRGDPIVARDTLEIFQYIKQSNKKIELGMNTNGSSRNKEWWTELAETNVVVRFGIDGLEDTHSLYRIGTNWKKIIENASIFINAGGIAIWDMLVFDHNKHQVDDCQLLANKLGFKNFNIKHTSRFRDEYLKVLTKEGLTSHNIYPSDKSKHLKQTIDNYDTSLHNNITCKVLKDKSIYINSQGYVIPCCWLDIHSMYPMHKSKIDILDNNIDFLSLKDFSLSEIFNKGDFNKISNLWKSKSLLECNKQCGKIDKFNLQF
jgi:MoaA/NifB/PqqE/SkfB family radical SAM enzyme